MEAVFVLVMLTLIGLCVWKEFDYHSETGENKMWRLNMIWLLIAIMLMPLIQRGCSQPSREGDGHGWEDR